MFCTVEELQLTSISQFYIQHNYTDRFSGCVNRYILRPIAASTSTRLQIVAEKAKCDASPLRQLKSRHRAIKCRLIALIATPFHADNNLTLQQQLQHATPSTSPPVPVNMLYAIHSLGAGSEESILAAGTRWRGKH